MFEIPEKVIQNGGKRGNLILIYSDYVFKLYYSDCDRWNRDLLFKNEVNFLKNYKSKYIIKLYYADPENRFIMIEKGDCTLKTALMQKLISIRLALKFIDKIEKEFQEHRIIHRDLSYHNMVYFIKTKKIKLIDFEVSSHKNTNIKDIYPKHRKTIDNFKRLKKNIKKLDIK